MSNRNGDFSAFLSGFFIGGLVGAAVALLFAPQSGEETRTVIRDKSIELRDQAVSQAEEARTLAMEAAEKARIRAEETAAQARARVDDVAKSTKDKASNLQQRGQVVLEEQRGKLEKAIEAGKQAAQKKLGKDGAELVEPIEAEEPEEKEAAA